jgi:hypothetical protein
MMISVNQICVSVNQICNFGFNTSKRPQGLYKYRTLDEIVGQLNHLNCLVLTRPLSKAHNSVSTKAQDVKIISSSIERFEIPDTLCFDSINTSKTNLKLHVALTLIMSLICWA